MGTLPDCLPKRQELLAEAARSGASRELQIDQAAAPRSLYGRRDRPAPFRLRSAECLVYEGETFGRVCSTRGGDGFTKSLAQHGTDSVPSFAGPKDGVPPPRAGRLRLVSRQAECLRSRLGVVVQGEGTEVFYLRNQRLESYGESAALRRA